MRTIALVALGVLALLPVPGAGQEGSRPGPRDTAALHVAALRHELGLRDAGETYTGRIWLHPYRARARDGLGFVPRSIAETTRRALEEAFPGIRFLSLFGEAWVCPPGVAPRTATPGCTVHEDGVIVDLGRMQVLEDSVFVDVTIWRSLSAEGRDHVYGSGSRLVFRRDASGDWIYVRTATRAVT